MKRIRWASALSPHYVHTHANYTHTHPFARVGNTHAHAHALTSTMRAHVRARNVTRIIHNISTHNLRTYAYAHVTYSTRAYTYALAPTKQKWHVLKCACCGGVIKRTRNSHRAHIRRLSGCTINTETPKSNTRQLFFK